MQYVGIAVIGVFLLGWIIPLVVGIVQLRRHHGPAGIILTVVGALWALPAIAAVVMAAIFYAGWSRDVQTHTFDATKQSGPHATLIVPWQGKGTLQYRHEGKRYVSESENGQFAVPAGRLSLSNFTAYSGPDKKGWQARSTLYEKGQLTLTANEQRQLAAGPPYAAQVKVREAAGKATLSLELKDAGGNSATLSDAGRKTPPRFEVLNAKGDTVWQGKFAYG